MYSLLKVVGYYDLSVLSMSVMGFQKKFGWGELYPNFGFFYFWNLFNFARPLRRLAKYMSMSNVNIDAEAQCRMFTC